MALVQPIGRAARNVNGKVLLYADKLTEAKDLRRESGKRSPRARRSSLLAYLPRSRSTESTTVLAPLPAPALTGGGWCCRTA
jgi:excinuclease UvrABC helicase subunit UvrB